MAEDKKIAGAVTVSLVDNWRDWKNWWSLRWLTLAAVITALPEVLKQLPPDLLAQLIAQLPPWAATAYFYLKIATLVGAGVSRVVAQKVPESTGPSVTQPADPPANPPSSP